MAVPGLFLVLYEAFRLLVECVRTPDEQIGQLAFDCLTMGEVLSAPMVILRCLAALFGAPIETSR